LANEIEISSGFDLTEAPSRISGCFKQKVNAIHLSGNKLMIQLVGKNWHVLSVRGDSDYNQKLALALLAKKNSRFVNLYFPPGYDRRCLIPDHELKVIKIEKLNF